MLLLSIFDLMVKVLIQRSELGPGTQLELKLCFCRLANNLTSEHGLQEQDAPDQRQSGRHSGH